MKFETIVYVCVKISSFSRERKKEKKSATGFKVKAKKQNHFNFFSHIPSKLCHRSRAAVGVFEQITPR